MRQCRHTFLRAALRGLLPVGQAAGQAAQFCIVSSNEEFSRWRIDDSAHHLDPECMLAAWADAAHRLPRPTHCSLSRLANTCIVTNWTKICAQRSCAAQLTSTASGIVGGQADKVNLE